MSTPVVSARDIMYPGEGSTLGERLRWAIQRAGETQSSFAARAGISRPLLSRWINDPDRPPSATSLMVLASELQVSLPWLHYGQGEPTEDEFSELVEPLATQERRRFKAKVSDGLGPFPEDEVVAGLFLDAIEGLTPEDAEASTGIRAATIRRIASLASAGEQLNLSEPVRDQMRAYLVRDKLRDLSLGYGAGLSQDESSEAAAILARIEESARFLLDKRRQAGRSEPKIEGLLSDVRSNPAKAIVLLGRMAKEHPVLDCRWMLTGEKVPRRVGGAEEMLAMAGRLRKAASILLDSAPGYGPAVADEMIAAASQLLTDSVHLRNSAAHAPEPLGKADSVGSGAAEPRRADPAPPDAFEPAPHQDARDSEHGQKRA